MNVLVKEKLIKVVFKQVDQTRYKCKNCSPKICFKIIDRRAIFLHIQLFHEIIWRAALFLPNALNNNIWIKLFRHPRNDEGSIDTSLAKCKHCTEIFRLNTRNILKTLLNHVKALHQNNLLDLSMVYTPLD